MKIGKRYYSEIIISDKQGNLLATITDEDVINEDGVRVEFVKRKDEDSKIEEFTDAIIDSIEQTGAFDKIVDYIIKKIK